METTRRQVIQTAIAGTALLATGGQALMAQASSASAGKGEWASASFADKTQMKVYVGRPSGTKAKVPGIIVLQEIFGVNSYIRDVVQRISALGYVAAAPDLFHRTAPGFEVGYAPADMNAGKEQYTKMTDDGLIADLNATYDLLKGDVQVDGDRIGSVGFCMGGRASFLANATLPLKAAVSYYGGGIADQLLPRAKDQNGPILLFTGGKDTHITADKKNAVAAALKAAGKPYVDVEFSEAGHGFANDQRDSYHPDSAREAWAITTAFFRDHLES